MKTKLTQKNASELFTIIVASMIVVLILCLLFGDAIVKVRPPYRDGVDTTTFIVNHSEIKP